MGKVVRFPSPDPLMMLGGPDNSLRIFIAPTPRALKTFFNTSALNQPGFYIGIWNDLVYVGGAADVAKRTRDSDWRGRSPPNDCLIGIVSAGAPWHENDGFALERIAYAALLDGGAPLDQYVPNGKVVGLPRYSQLQAIYAECVQLLRIAVPVVAFPFQNPPDRLRDGDRAPVLERRVAIKQTATMNGVATVRCEGERRWIVEAGSIIRFKATESTGAINKIRRDELEFCGCLVPLDNGSYRLTCDLLFSSRSKCSGFVHCARGAIENWQLLTTADAQKLANAVLHPFPPAR